VPGFSSYRSRNSLEIVQFAKSTDTQMLEIGPLLKRGWTYIAAFHEVIQRLTPDDQIRALHTRAVENGERWCLISIGNFGHVVVWGVDRDKALAKVNDALKRQVEDPALPQRDAFEVCQFHPSVLSPK
jgi:uncharacterized Rmd1/YagE family protein